MKFYQDVALDYQNTYEAFHAQQWSFRVSIACKAYLIEEALAAIKAAEAKVQQRHQELLDAQCTTISAEIESAISRAVEQYKVQLSTAQSSLQTWDHEHQLVIQKTAGQNSITGSFIGQSGKPAICGGYSIS